MVKVTPLSRMAWAISWASSLVRASTFSVKMCLPALAAASRTSLCWLVAVVTWMPWMELSAQMASKSGWKGTPSVWAMAWPRAWSSSHRQASWAWGFFKMAWAYSWVWTCHARSLRFSYNIPPKGKRFSAYTIAPPRAKSK